jgi:fatty acid desaturase
VVTQAIKPADVSALVRDLHEKRSFPGWARLIVMTPVLLGLIGLTLAQDHPLAFAVCGLLTGFFYASYMVLTHDAIHHTLTGSRFWDEAIPRLMSWPLLWPHGSYSAIHMVHHKMNGRHEEDPERCHLTWDEYQNASRLQRFIARNQLLFRVLVFAGFGMIFDTIRKAKHLEPRTRAPMRQLRRDTIGIIVTVTLILVPAFWLGFGVKALILWLVLERTVGGVQQFRAHLEHYGLWSSRASFLEAQLYNCRNFRTNPLASLYFNHLNYHSVHHAFPGIPFYNLKEAHERLARYCRQNGAPPLVEEQGYAHAALSIIRSPKFVQPMSMQRRTQPWEPSGQGRDSHSSSQHVC